ncbi:hypothetical protein ZIOFF_022618 [Zingiber officinale]|uniref:Uncharacterized protein n=1 Tax=Zingiber officinale TaxID=94328 RepID=A0A8J5H3A6_ZINOF|nr:hypothetical protein ZIOFF_022618 [Zingiber officinale]
MCIGPDISSPTCIGHDISDPTCIRHDISGPTRGGATQADQERILALLRVCRRQREALPKKNPPWVDANAVDQEVAPFGEYSNVNSWFPIALLYMLPGVELPAYQATRFAVISTSFSIPRCSSSSWTSTADPVPIVPSPRCLSCGFPGDASLSMISLPLEPASGIDASSSSIDPSQGLILKLSSASFGALLALAVEFLSISRIGDHGRKERGKRVFVECGGARGVAWSGHWSFLDVTNGSSRFLDFGKSSGVSVLELVTTQTKIRGVHNVQV